MSDQNKYYDDPCSMYNCGDMGCDSDCQYRNLELDERIKLFKKNNEKYLKKNKKENYRSLRFK